MNVVSYCGGMGSAAKAALMEANFIGRGTELEKLAGMVVAFARYTLMIIKRQRQLPKILNEGLHVGFLVFAVTS